jgi:hypothetical protein
VAAVNILFLVVRSFTENKLTLNIPGLQLTHETDYILAR